jgi:hypothetical protein
MIDCRRDKLISNAKKYALMCHPISNIYLFALFAIFATQAHGKTSEVSLCSPSEITYFACQTNTKKVISICGGKSNSLQYRFGKRDAVELQFPQEAKNGAQQFRYAHYFRPQTDYWELYFSNSGVSYTVFERYEDARKFAGLELKLADGKEKTITCVGKFASKLGKLESFVPCDKESALNLGSCPSK